MVPSDLASNDLVLGLGRLAEEQNIEVGEDAFRKAVEGFTSVMEAMPLQVILLDREGKVILWNRCATLTFGHSVSEVRGKVLPIVPPDRQEEFQGNLALAVEGHSISGKLTRRRRKDGVEIDVELWAAPMIDARGRTYANLWIISDLTDKIQSQEALARGEETLRLAMRGGKMGFWTRNLQTEEVYWSPELESLFKIPIGSFAGNRNSFLQHIHPDDVSEFKKAVQDSILSGKEYSVEFRFVRGDGTEGWMDGRGQATFDDSGRPLRIDGFGIDITERKLAQQALAESEQRLRLLAEALPIICWSLDAEGHLDFVNLRYEEYTGLSRDGTPDMYWSKVVHPEDLTDTRISFGVARREERVWSQELRLLAASGEYRWHLSRMEPIRDSSGQIIRWFGTSTDIQDQKVAEAELERRVTERTEALTLAIQELEGFTYSVSHDLRAPLRAINSSSMILLEDLGKTINEEHRERLVRQAHNSQRLGVLIDDLLKLSRINRQDMERVELNISKMSQEVADDIVTRGEANEVNFVIEQDMVDKADPVLLRFVFINLFENAVKFSPNGGTVTVGRKGSEYFVSDQGIGFDTRYLDKLFMPFERLVTDKEYPGTGIGLANVQRIIQRHGGIVWAESEIGKGSTFFFTLHPK
ncbi:PAS domain S-box protein [soil metagenome]